jgi:hypothetical protein
MISLFKMFSPEQIIMAGLLTFSFCTAFPFSVKTVAEVVQKRTEITAAGTVQDFHLIPYYPEM